MWTIIAIYFAVMIGIGFVTSRMVKDSSGYFLGDKSLGPVLTAFRFASTFESGAAMVGTPGMGYGAGYPGFLQGFLSPLGYFMSFRVFGLRIKVACDHFKTITVPQLLEKRYDSTTVRVLSSLAIIVGLGGTTVAQFKAMGEIFSSTLNINYMPAVLIGVAVVGLYSLLGGYLATVWTNLIQGVIMLVGAILMICYTSIAAFGTLNVFKLPSLINAELIEINPNMLTITGGGVVSISLIVVIVAVSLCSGLAMPQQTVTLFSMRDLRTSRLALVICSFFSVIVLWGLVLSAMMGHVILPPVSNHDQVIPILMKEVMPPVLSGFFLAAVLSAIMSTVGSVILVASSAISQDIFNVLASNVYNKRPVFYDRLAVLVMTAIPLLVALWPPSVIFWIMLFSFALIVITFLMPMIGTIFWKKGTKQGAIASMLVGIILVPVWTIIGEPWISALLLGFIVSPLVFLVVSLMTKPNQEIVELLWDAYSLI